MNQPVEAQMPRDQNVRILAGPFRNFVGTIEGEIPEHGKVTVTLRLFGRPVRFELDRDRVVKI
jgi:transcriptional antiterminator NusG